MRKDAIRSSLVVAGGLLLAPAVAHAAPPSADQVQASYVLLAPSPADGTVALARVVIDTGLDCPILAFEDGSTVAMSARENPHPATFPIEVCEALYPFGQSALVGGTDIRLPAVSDQPTNITMFGDTGCYGGASQDCDDPQAWPFGAFAADAAAEGTELVIHVGDYNYRGSPGEISVHGVEERVYDAGGGSRGSHVCQSPDVDYVSQNTPDSPHFDNWRDWRLDFFDPARPLLAQAPWVFTRGNHELCSRAGPGWFYLLDPGSALLGGDYDQASCPPQVGDNDHLMLSQPYRLDLGTLRLIVMDTANACDERANFPEIYAAQLLEVLTPDEPRPTWLVTHRPVWGMRVEAEYDERGATEVVINETLQHALRDLPDGELPSDIQMVLSGHMHRFQAVSFDSGRPPQLIVGGGGGELSPYLPKGPFTTTVDQESASGVSRDAFGYMRAMIEPDGSWRGEVVNPLAAPDKRLIATCAAPSSAALCELKSE